MQPEAARALGELPGGDASDLGRPVPAHAGVVDEVRVGRARRVRSRRAAARASTEWSRKPSTHASVAWTSGGSPTIAVRERGPSPGEDAELHVGQRADRGACAVVVVEVPVDEGEADAPIALAQGGEDADEDAAAAADDERDVGRVEELRERLADRLGGVADLPVGEDARGRVAHVVGDVDVEVAEVGDGDARGAQRRRRGRRRAAPPA